MERDLAALRAHRVKREQEATAGRTRISAEADRKQSGQSEQIAEHHNEAARSLDDDTEAVDVIMTDHPVKAEADGHAEQPGEMNLEASSKAESSYLTEEQDPDPPPQIQLAIATGPLKESNAGAIDNQSDEAEEAENATNTKAPLADERPVSAGIGDVNFESMFDDSAGDGHDEEIDFDLDFPHDTDTAQALMDNNPFHTETSNGNASNVHPATTEDIDSLLPGLESFANSADDFAMIELPPASTTIENAGTTTPITRPSITTADVPPDLLPPESNFDDMFFDSADFTMEDGNGGGNGGDDAFGEIGDFDESWFKSDGT
ncbi:MAG: hypothetical protein M1830_010318 [Pleopsidium flavum]|nr:MAG: hypothetical protein M1830_010318 [Pleopsidium flavum]